MINSKAQLTKMARVPASTEGRQRKSFTGAKTTLQPRSNKSLRPVFPAYVISAKSSEEGADAAKILTRIYFYLVPTKRTFNIKIFKAPEFPLSSIRSRLSKLNKVLSRF